MEVSFILIFICSYIIGSIPFAYLLTLLFGFGDIRKLGSGNVGATNALRTGKKSLATTVLIFDILKGFIPITFLFLYYELNYSNFLIIFFGSLTILGHVFPIWLKFKGGKGVATYLGFILGINYKIGLVFIFSWILVAFYKRYSSLASIMALICVSISSLIFLHDIKIIYFIISINILIIFMHNSNIKKLINGSENKIKF